jgi:hypothetical protein
MYCGKEYTLYSLEDEHAKQRKLNGNNLRKFFKKFDSHRLQWQYKAA